MSAGFFKKKLLFSAGGIIFFSLFFLSPLILMPAEAADINNSFGSELNKIIKADSGYTEVNNPIEKLSAHVGLLLGWTTVIGVVMLIHMVLAGYEYMTAHGEPEKILAAKKRVRNVIIATVILIGGLIIDALVVSLWSAITGTI